MIVAAYTKVEDGMVKFFNHLHKVVALVPVHIVALIKQIEADVNSDTDGHAETSRARRSRSDRSSGDDGE